MRLTTGLGAALGLLLPAVAFAQPTATRVPDPAAAPPASSGTVNPSTSSPAPPAAAPSAPAAPGAAVNTSATITTGMAVKDKNGKPIGKVADVKTDASGKQTATIAMGADKFAVDTAALAVDNGSAMINASQVEIRAMMKKGH